MQNILLTTAQHPLYPPDTITKQSIICLLEQNKLFAIGEIGLDKRNSNLEWQKEIFLDFLDIAHQFKKPVFIHCVGHHYEILTLIKRNFSDLVYIMHAFHGSLELVKEFSKLDIIFSLHQNILKTKNAGNILNEIIKKHDFAFETDEDKEGINDVMPTIHDIAHFVQKDVDLLLKRQYCAFQKLLCSNSL